MAMATETETAPPAYEPPYRFTEARQHLRAAIGSLKAIAVDRCPGSEELVGQMLDTVRKSLHDLLAVRDNDESVNG